ncbi:amidohydrolase [Myxococcota bacterium]|nr:amidohydrolase [Myxococcota bacterium]
MMRRTTIACALAASLASGCAGPQTPAKKKPVTLLPVLGERSPRVPEAAVSKAERPAPPVVVIAGATLLLGTGARVDDGTIVLEGGKIRAAGAKKDVAIPAGAKVIDGRGKFVTPGLVDTHSHMGVYASPSTFATADGNEMTDPTTPYVFSEHAFWPQDPAIEHAVAGGVTTAQILPGSGNIIGGRAVTMKLRPETEARAMRFEGAPYGLKMACGENPKRVYGTTNRAPMSRMGSVARLRQAFIKAQEYRWAQRAYQAEYEVWKKKYDDAKASPETADDPGKEPRPIDRDLGLETLADVLEGKILVHVHCYRADEMLLMLSLARELGFRISSFHHAVEAYKLAPQLAKEDVAASIWADWWGFKLEAWDSIEENAAILEAAGATPIIHSDSAIGIQRLNQEAAKAMHAGRRAGLAITEDEAITWITRNPAKALGVLDRTGTLEAGKAADVVLWDRSPLSIYAAAELVFVDGALAFDAKAPRRAWSDFSVGAEIEEVTP